MSWAEAQMVGPVSIGYRCTDNQHGHYRRKKVDELVKRGDVKWLGSHYRVAYWVEHRTWQGKQSDPRGEARPGLGTMGVMQLVKGRPGRKR